MQWLLWRKYASLAVVFPLGTVLQSILPRWEAFIPIMIGTLGIWCTSASCIWAIPDHSTWGRITNLPQNIPEFFTICLVIPYPRQHLSHSLLVSRKCQIMSGCYSQVETSGITGVKHNTVTKWLCVFHIPVHSFFHSTTIYGVIHCCRCRYLAAIKTHQASILLYNASGGDPCLWKEKESRKINWWKECCYIKQIGQVNSTLIEWITVILLFWNITQSFPAPLFNWLLNFSSFFPRFLLVPILYKEIGWKGFNLN